MSLCSSETTYFWRLASELQRSLRDAPCGNCVAQAYADIEGLAFTTDNVSVRNRCEALLNERGAVELTREPFYGDIEHIMPNGAIVSEFDNLSFSCNYLS